MGLLDRPALSTDGMELWFTRTVNSAPAILRSVWEGAAWSAPAQLNSGAAGFVSVGEVPEYDDGGHRGSVYMSRRRGGREVSRDEG